MSLSTVEASGVKRDVDISGGWVLHLVYFKSHCAVLFYAVPKNPEHAPRPALPTVKSPKSAAFPVVAIVT